MKNKYIIDPVDLAIITGKKKTFCYKLYNTIKEKFQLEKHQLVTITQVCEVMRWEPDAIARILEENKNG